MHTALPWRAYLLYGVKVYSVARSLDLSVSPSHTVQPPTPINVANVSTWSHAARHKLCFSFQPTHSILASCSDGENVSIQFDNDEEHIRSCEKYFLPFQKRCVSLLYAWLLGEFLTNPNLLAASGAPNVLLVHHGALIVPQVHHGPSTIPQVHHGAQ